MRDSDVRAAVWNALRSEYRGDSNTRIVEEMGLWSGTVRIDIAVINGELNGFELKSDRDTLERLPLQADIYSRIFDHVSLVVGKRHASKASEIIPKWWGITIATMGQNGVALSIKRKAKRNPNPDLKLIAGLLWRDEALAVLDSYGLAKGWKSRRVNELHERLALEVPYALLSASVRETLKAREGWLGQRVGNKL